MIAPERDRLPFGSAAEPSGTAPAGPTRLVLEKDALFGELVPNPVGLDKVGALLRLRSRRDQSVYSGVAAALEPAAAAIADQAEKGGAGPQVRAVVDGSELSQ